MRLRFLCVVGAWLASCAASPVASRSADASMPQKALANSHASFPIVTGHEIHMPYATIPGSKEDEAKYTPRPYLAMKIRTESNALFVNDVPVFPSSFPMHLPATRYQDVSGQNPEHLLLQYAVDIEYMPPRPDGSLVQDIYRVQLKFFDPSGHPATTNTVHVRLSTQQSGELYITQIIVEPFLDYYHDAHGDGNCVWRTKYWNLIMEKYRAWREQKGPGHHKGPESQKSDDHEHNDHHHHPKANSPVSNEQPTAHQEAQENSPLSKADPSNSAPESPFRVYGVDKSLRPTALRNKDYRRDFWRLVVPAIIPGLLGAVAGLVVCTMGLLLWKMVACTCARMQGRRCRKHCQRKQGVCLSEKQRLLQQDQLSEA
ncbi:hypothetical protein CBS147343_8523 [Aspergillus niger]|uniref:Uncharacterized protein n=1 Tax=Aspergillus niger TaxID=5061 RepID=A0A9W6EBE6_ASPNG|nr:uncharacterized protein BO96DRAFT_502965 [Aspergillus niger CBS 101883]KAI2838212.1 hypothetical protein CBS11350_8272 [Aspergillus niger]KAI2885236.1 hypothetical protein CBS11852_8370 [Aspergillus niger]KAI2918591.1 hypothetical protein CBS147320_8922 [Aspergillus niger]KAI2936653.1 hypothetical protein CBS147321_8432 [Aspergillus niger]KAI2944493.1 hypothetical protein CBS147322_8123 [Aspergillus niger]